MQWCSVYVFVTQYFDCSQSVAWMYEITHWIAWKYESWEFNIIMQICDMLNRDPVKLMELCENVFSSVGITTGFGKFSTSRFCPVFVDVIERFPAYQCSAAVDAAKTQIDSGGIFSNIATPAPAATPPPAVFVFDTPAPAYYVQSSGVMSAYSYLAENVESGIKGELQKNQMRFRCFVHYMIAF